MPAVPAELPANETERLGQLRRLSVLDSLPEQVYDDLALLASRLCGTPIALLTLVDEHRQWFKAKVGVQVSETPRDIAFCAHAIGSPDEVFLIPDASADHRFASNPLVTGDTHLRFYAGAPVVTHAGHALGTVCVIDTQPRQLSAEQSESLKALARQAAALLELREQSARLQQATLALDHEVSRRKALLAEANDAIVAVRPDFTVAEANHRFAEMLGYPVEQVLRLHPWDWDVRLDTREKVAAHRPLLAAARSSFDSVWRRADGSHIEVEINFSHVNLPEGEVLLLVCRDVTDSNHNKRQLQKTTELLRQMGSMASVGGWELDLVTNKMSWTAEVYRIHDVDPSIEPNLVDGINFYAPQAQPKIAAAVQAAVDHGTPWDLELPFISATGRQLWVRAQGGAEFDQHKAVRLYGAFQDVTQRVEAEQALLASEHRVRMITDNLPALVTYVDADKRYRFVNAFITTIYHIPPAWMLGRTMVDVCGEEIYATIATHVEAALRGEHVSFHGSGSSPGRTFQYQCDYVPDIDEAGNVRGFYSMTFDITALKESQEKLERLAHVDALTGLPNRRQFEARLREAMANTRHHGLPMVIMFMDIDHFKSVNDSVGHAAGDLVLCEFARRLRHTIRSDDMVARLGGDEFVVLMEGIDDGSKVASIAAKIVAAVRPPIQLADDLLQVTTSVGIAHYYGGEDTPEQLLGLADSALYACKKQGRDRFIMV